jgi:hypothetical protein
MNGRYSKSWDAFVLRAISRGDVCHETNCTARVGGRLVWVENYPYAAGTPHSPSVNVSPSAKTIDLLIEALAVSPARKAP